MSAVSMAPLTIFQPPQPSPEDLYQSAMALWTKQENAIDKDYSEVIPLLKEAVKQNHLQAMAELGRFYQIGTGVPQDLNRAIDLFTRAANAQDPAAKFYLAQSYWKGIGVPKDHIRARDLLKEASDLGLAKATTLLGVIYKDGGEGVPVDLNLAIQLFIQASDAGDLNAKIVLIYYYDNGIGVPKDLKKVVDLYKELEKGGHKDAPARLGLAYDRLGLAYQEGDENLPQNYIFAEKYFRLGALKGNPASIRHLGILYFEGYGVPQNFNQAITFFNEAIGKGDLRSYAYLGSCYCFGEGVPVDLNHAYSLFLRGKEDAACMYWLGLCAKDGVGENPGPNQAQEWFRQSAKKNHPWNQAAQQELRAAEVPQE